MIATHHPISGKPLLYVDVRQLPELKRGDACRKCAFNVTSEQSSEYRTNAEYQLKLVKACSDHECFASDDQYGFYLVDTPDNRAQIAIWRVEA